MKTLYLHIGTPKTGTTSIQYFCELNREALRAKGYSFPDMPFRYLGRGHNRNGSFLVAPVYDEDNNRRKDREKENLELGLKLLAQEFERYDNVILSDENIWFRAARTCKGLWKRLRKESAKAGYQIKVLVYLRRQDTFTDAQWNQRVKHLYTETNSITWEQYAQQHSRFITGNYYENLQEITRQLGEGTVIARRFDRKFFVGGTLQADFLHAIGLEMDDSYTLGEVSNMNQRLQGNIPEIQRIANELPMSRKEFYRLGEAAHACSPLSHRDYPCSMMSADEARQFMAQFEEGNRKLAEEYIGDGQPLFSDAYPETLKWMPDNPYMQQDIIRYLTACNLQLMREIDALRAEMKEEVRKNRSFVLRVWQKLKRIFKK